MKFRVFPRWNYEYLSYDAELRKDNAKPTTKPRTVRRMLDTSTISSKSDIALSNVGKTAGYRRECIRMEIDVKTVDHIVINVRGRINRGMILPCIRRKVGHFECLSRSRGPC